MKDYKYDYKYITQEQYDAFETMLNSETANIDELKIAVRILIAQVDVMGEKAYDPAFGDNKLCECGHTYYRHFDTYEDMAPVGCKYCGHCNCGTFRDSGKVEIWEDQVKRIEESKPK